MTTYVAPFNSILLTINAIRNLIFSELVENLRVREVRSKILTPLDLETTGREFIFTVEIQMYIQGVNKSTVGIQMYIQGIYTSTVGIQMYIQGVNKFTVGI